MRMVLLGHSIYAHLERSVGRARLEKWGRKRRGEPRPPGLPLPLPPRVDGAQLRASLEAALGAEPGIGPTTTKMLLVKEPRRLQP